MPKLAKQYTTREDMESNSLRVETVACVPDYFIREDGVVWHAVTGKIVPHGNMGGNRYEDRPHYVAVVLRDRNCKRFPSYLHRLLAEAFIPNPRNFPSVLHKDDNPRNFDLSNLMWGDDLINQRQRREREQGQIALYLNDSTHQY